MWLKQWAYAGGDMNNVHLLKLQNTLRSDGVYLESVPGTQSAHYQEQGDVAKCYQ